MGFNGEKWWACPTCGGTTEVEGNTRECTQCDWSVTIPMQSESSPPADETLHEFVDAEEHADGLYAYLVGDRFAVLHARDYPRGEPPIDWFIRRVQDRGAEEASGPEFLCYNPGPEEFDAGDEDTVREFIGLVDEARIVSLGDAPRWGDASALVEVTGDA